MSKFIVTPKEDKTVTMTIRIDATLQEEYNKSSSQTGIAFLRYFPFSINEHFSPPYGK